MRADPSDFNLISHNENKISERSIDRLRRYLCILDLMESEDESTVSSGEIANLAGVKSGLVRKDFCRFGGFGRPSVGYNISYLRKQIRDILKLNEQKHIALIGVKALELDTRLEERLAENNCRIDVIFTTGSLRLETNIQQIPINSTENVSGIIRDAEIEFAIISDIGDDCRSLIDALASGGVKAILNLTSVPIKAPPDVAVKNIDIPGEIITLSLKYERDLEH